MKKAFAVPEDQVKAWEQFYAVYFGIDVDFSKVKLPEKRQGFDQLIVVAKGMTPNKVIEAMRKKFDCHLYADDLDQAVPKNDREPKGHYAIWIRERVEADEELKNLSANQLEEKGIAGITLLERLLGELFHFWKTGNHLYIENWTLCSGSRHSDGCVPYVYWDPCKRELRVYGCDSGYVERNGLLRSRAVVSS